MAIRIGHASKDERGKFTGGTAGDQTGKEVCIRSWYNGGWTFVARAKDPAKAEQIAANCEAACNNPNCGYDQSGRNTGLQAAKAAGWDLGKVKEPCEFDCSSLTTACIQAAGINVWSGGNAMTTSSKKRKLKATGAFQILTEDKYLTGPTYLKRGDLLCKPGSHVVMVLDDGPNAEKSPVPESDIKPEVPKADRVTVYYSVRLPLLEKGSEGPAVEALQILLKGRGYSLGRFGPNKDGMDGEFGDATENALEAFQEDNVDTEGKPLEVDGKAGPKTWAAIIMN